MNKRSKRIRHGIVVTALGITQVITPVMAIAETTEQEQTVNTLDKSDQLLETMTESTNDANGNEAQAAEDAETDYSSEASKEESSAGSENTEPSETSTSASSNRTEDSSNARQESSSTSDSKEIKEEQQTPRVSTRINDQELLEKGTLLTIAGEEFSRTEETRILNNSPVKLKLDFEINNKDYFAGTTAVFDLPQGLGFSDVQGTNEAINASWAVDSAAHQLMITFNQSVHDASFSIELTSYLYSEDKPQLTIEIGDQNQTSYAIDLYEEVDPIQYVSEKNVFGMDGMVYYNTDRTLSGTETLSLNLVDTPGASFKKIETQPLKVFSYEVDIKGKIKPETQTALVEGTDYTITSNSLYNTAVEIKQMDKQKAYGVSYQFTMSLTELTEYTPSFSKGYPTTGFGSVQLKQTTAQNRGFSFIAKTSKDEKEVDSRYYMGVASASFMNGLSKGNYYVSIHQMPTEMKAGQQIILSSQNGQPITAKQLTARDAFYQNVTFSDYFSVENNGDKLIVTATKDSNLTLGSTNVTVPFDQKDIILNVSTPLIDNREFKIVEDNYVEPISVLNPNNAETAWGNYDQNGAYMSDTSINIEGSNSQPIENLQMFIEHPEYLSLRKVPKVSFYYTLGKDYTIEEVAGGTMVTFTSPITYSVQFDIGFNYVPDSLAPTKSIPNDTIPITISATGLDTVHTSVYTGRKLYSERTLQSSMNQFLVNARQDTISDLTVETHVPKNTDVVFSIIDVSNEQVSGIYPQYWDRGYYDNQAMKESDPNYPTITHDEETNYYTFDFGTTNRRYIISYQYANGWQEMSTIYVPGYAKEPLSNNQQGTATVSVSNTATDIIGITQNTVNNTKNMTQVKVTTKNIDDGSKKVANPTILLKSLGNTNGEIDLGSITVSNVPDDSYEVKEVDGNIQLVFSNYVLTKNIEISYNVLSQNAGQISASATIVSDTIDTLSEAKRTATSTVANLQFSAGDSSGIIYKTNATLDVYNTEEPTEKIAGVTLTLWNQLTGDIVSVVTDENGEYQLTDIYTGNYTLYVSYVPEGYVIPQELQLGKEVQVNRTGNHLSVGITPEEDLSTIDAKDSTIYVGDEWHAEDNFVSATDKHGNAMTFSEITVNGEVDTTNVGTYEVKYINGSVSQTATITVVANQETVAAKDSTLYVGDAWTAADNFLSATDKDGNAVTIADVTITGEVDTDTPGEYQVIYRNGKAEATATITVLADQTSVKVKDSTLYVGDDWHAADNFVSATDKTGANVPFSNVTVSGTVDTSKEGQYPVVYQNGNQKATATITVVANQETVVAKDSTLYVGDAWELADNFVSATDKKGQPLSLAEVTTSGDVDTKVPGEYQVIYRNGKAEAKATITVLADQTSIKAKDSTLYVGDDWQAIDNFVSATDKAGANLPFSAVTVSGLVDTSKEGQYKVTYSNGKTEAIATITVVANQETVAAKDSTLYVGDSWEAADNFLSATDKDGKALPLTEVTVDGIVDTSKAGRYEVVYRNGKAEAKATITVLADQTSVKAKDSNLYVGDEWQAIGNFVSATDKTGANLPFSGVTVSGSVDTSKAGEYPVVYQNGHVKATATITVVANQETVVAKDSTIYVDDNWQAADNFVSAKDKDGNELKLADITTVGTVDSATPGKYEVVYRNGKAEATATITVLADQTSVKAKDSTLYVGDDWEAADNFVSATDKTGATVELSGVMVTGTVDTNQEGTYDVTYTNGKVSATATITVVAHQETVVAKDSTIYEGEKWQAVDNFVSATDKSGQAVDYDQVLISGTVNTDVPGKYQVIYRNGKAEATATITVLADQTSVTVKDSVIYVGDNWTAADNFVSATDRDGKSLTLEQLLVDGSVDTKKTGTYQVTYSIVTDEAATPNFFARLFGTRSQEAVTATATIKVVEKAEEPEEDDQQPTKDDSNKGQEKPTNEGQTGKQTKATAKDKRLLPKTGTAITQGYSIAGVSLVALAGIVFFRKKHTNKRRKTK
ncbi:LPXTG-domain-containing protein cell wall anchor domain protein [Enterococcus casseliflavus]|uniref:bacterial Ig-like domain-containing protein n=1 Tax=Enterococcus casseliflavus TaxID=37734 RepID=UPI000DFFC5E4|nr:bacterial Ig-like domain-containing protein [Enterococcus casseliflavus]GEB27098.1 cell wall anchor [Enterococcus casseliflavus]STP34243.1 LPXTG-domain-containing protein cell wall anchor domain protein [Enterococcus casseliflavus]